MTNSVKSIVFIDNDRVRVTEWRLPSGASVGWHRHAYDYVVVPIKDGLLRLLEPGGIGREVQLRQGVPYFRNAGVEHDVVNANADEYAFIEIEIK